MKILILGLLISGTCLGETITYTKIGNTVYGSDGSTETKIGNTVYVHKPDTEAEIKQREESGENARQMGVAVGNLFRRLFTSPPPPQEQK